jgi:two-component system chemotaxis response regulator CheB
LFRSAAYAYGPRVVGVVLTGMLGDGTAGLGAIKDHGGVAIVQEPQEALWASMPQNALQQVAVDYRLPLAEVPPTLVGLSATPPPEERAFPISTQESP